MSLHLYIFLLYLYQKTEKKETKKIWPLCRVHSPKHSAKWPSQVSKKKTLLSSKVLALGKAATWNDRWRLLCRVPRPGTRQSSRHLTPHVAALPRAEALGKRLCRVPNNWHSAKPPLLSGALPSGVCRVLHSAKALPSANRPLPSVTGTRQSQ